MKKIKKSVFLILVFIFSALTLIGCNKNDFQYYEDDESFKIVKKDLTNEELEINNRNDILNIARGYVNAWNKNNDKFLENVLDDDTFKNKDAFINGTFKKSLHKTMVKKYIESISIEKYKESNATVVISCDNKGTANIVDLFQKNIGKENITLKFVNRDNKWFISEISSTMLE